MLQLYSCLWGGPERITSEGLEKPDVEGSPGFISSIVKRQFYLHGVQSTIFAAQLTLLPLGAIKGQLSNCYGFLQRHPGNSGNRSSRTLTLNSPQFQRKVSQTGIENEDNYQIKVVLRPKKQFFFFFGFQNYVN